MNIPLTVGGKGMGGWGDGEWGMGAEKALCPQLEELKKEVGVPDNDPASNFQIF